MLIAFFLFGLGVSTFLIPRRFASEAQRRLDRLEELEAGAEERFFEEHRTLKAYPPAKNPWPYRLVGVAIMIASVKLYFDLAS